MSNWKWGDGRRATNDVYMPLRDPDGKLSEVVLHCSGVPLSVPQVKDGFARENPTIYWSDDRNCHWFFDFKIAIKDGATIWCELLKANNELNEFWVHFYRR